MLAHSRILPAILLGLLISVSPSLAGGKAGPKSQVGPAVPGFARFYAHEKANVAEGGHLLLGSLNCAHCHLSKQPDQTLPAPILDGVGTRVKVSYLRDFISDPHKTKPGTTMPNLFVGVDDDDKKAKVEALVHLLASTGTIAQIRPDVKGINAGRDLFHKVGCVACHGTRDVKGDQDKLFATSVPLGNLKAKYSLASLKMFLENPHQTRPAGRMPKLLNAKEASDIANYLVQGSGGSAAGINMTYSYYEGNWQNLPDFSKLKPKATGQASDFDLGVALRKDDCGLKFDGFVKIEKDGNYSFYTTSDDGSKLWINDKLVVDNDGIHPPQTKAGKLKLTKGMHKLTVGVFNASAGFELGVEIEGSGLGRQPLGPLVFLTDKAEPAPVV